MSTKTPTPLAELNDPSRPSVKGMEWLQDRMADCDTLEEWSHLLGEHLQFGNKKIADHVAIFNLGTATDCVNLHTERCQVGEACYALKAERAFPGTWDYRRRQEYLWDALDPDTFAAAFELIVKRRRTETTALRINESGDLRHQGDVSRLAWLAENLEGVVDVYLYTASSHLDLSPLADAPITVNASNDMVAPADRRFVAVPTPDDVPDGAVRCPHDIDKSIQCGDCRACIGDRAGDVYITIH